MRKSFRDEIREDNQLVSNKELKTLVDVAFIGAALKWRKSVIQSKRDSLPSALLTERVKEDELLVRGPSQDVLLEEFSCSLSIKKTEDILAVVRNANPNAPAKEFGAAYRAFKLQAALVWHKSRAYPGKTASFSPTDRSGQPS